MIDGEVLALDELGKPYFDALQNNASSSPLQFVVFDLLVLAGRDVRHEPLSKRRELLEKRVLPMLAVPIRYSPQLDASLRELVHAVKEQGFEGLFAKRRNSVYEPSERSGAWLKMRVNRGQEFVIGGYTVGGDTFDALVFGYYNDDGLIYAARTRNGFTPTVRGDLMKRFKGLKTDDVSVHQPAGEKDRTLGSRTHGKEDGGLPVVEASARGAVRVCRVDGGSHLRHSRFIA